MKNLFVRIRNLFFKKSQIGPKDFFEIACTVFTPLKILKWVAAFLLLYFSFKLHEPVMCRYRTVATLLFPALTIFFMIRSYKALKARRGSIWIQCEKALFLLVMVSTAFVISYDIAAFHYRKQVVLSTSEALLNRLGRHFIVGYRNPEDIHLLLNKRAIGGVYVTARNIHNKSWEEVRRELGSFQSIAIAKGDPPLFLAADQEGGKVSRLSPLLDPMPPLSAIISSNTADQQLTDNVTAYASVHGEQLSDLGINLNLSPVVDLKTNSIRHRLNIHSRIDQRAISDKADTVARVAATYSATLLEHGVRPTLKHFPGLGSVTEDTHFNLGTLDSSKPELDQNDWRPFKEIITRTDPFIMLGHVKVASIDPALPASLSHKIITGIIRNEWNFNGVLITDDLNMGAIAERREGLGKSAVRALNAGADLILLSFDGSQYYNIMYEMIKADKAGTLDKTALKKSAQRLLASKPS